MSPATTVAAPAPPRVAPDEGTPRRLWTIAEMIRMVEAGILEEGGPEYLLDGEMFCRMTRNPPHSTIKANLYECLRDRLDLTTWTVRVEDPIVLRPDSNPEPDLVVARGARLDYARRHPVPADVALVIEVADSSISLDLGRKLRAYAAAGIPQYWVVAVEAHRVEVYENPRIEQGVGAYDLAGIFVPGKAIPLAMAGRDGAEATHLPAILVDDVFAGFLPEAP